MYRSEEGFPLANFRSIAAAEFHREAARRRVVEDRASGIDTSDVEARLAKAKDILVVLEADLQAKRVIAGLDPAPPPPRRQRDRPSSRRAPDRHRVGVDHPMTAPVPEYSTADLSAYLETQRPVILYC